VYGQDDDAPRRHFLIFKHDNDFLNLKGQGTDEYCRKNHSPAAEKFFGQEFIGQSGL
jgi:hypothetical protein